MLIEKEIAKDTFQVEIEISQLNIDRNKIGMEIGYSHGEIPDYFDELILYIISKLKSNCDVKAGYKILDMQYSKDNSCGFTIGDIFFNTDRIVTSQLKKADKVAIFLATIGPKMEQWSKQLIKEGDSILGYLVDVTASAMIETVVDILHDHIQLKMKNFDWNITNRYSPGYCNWSVEEQKKLFSFLPPNFCNVKLTDTSLMIPIKSISGIIGIGKEVKYSEYICERCGIKDCTHRIYLLSKRKINNELNV